MLCSLSVRNVLLIRKLDIEFGVGLNVLTGETGTGKSILLDSLGFVLGSRIQANMQASGGDGCEVAACFDPTGNRAAQAVLEDLEIPAGSELQLRRTLQASGRTSSFVNDRRCTVEALGRLADALVEIHGQADDRGLLNPANHRQLLDQFAGHDQLVRRVRRVWRSWREAGSRLKAAEGRLVEAERNREFVEHAVGELEQLGPEVGEDQELDQRRSTLKLFVRFQENLSKAEEAIGAAGAEGKIDDAIGWLQNAVRMDESRIGEALLALDRAIGELGEAQRQFERVRADNDSDPGEIERVEERLFAIRALARKHSVRPDRLEDVARSLADSLEDLDRLTQEVDRLQLLVKTEMSKCAGLAEQLSISRSAAASRLDAAMAAETGPLRLKNTIFRTDLQDEKFGPEGKNRIAFVVSTNPSLPPGPIGTIASGGELSRFMLALKVCLMSDADGVCAVFDEIDRGIGGATANAVGRRLRSLAATSQVLVVTHSPQVAAMGHHHWRVEKHSNGGVARTIAVKLDDKSRNNEIARMLAGERITDEARAAASALLNAV